MEKFEEEKSTRIYGFQFGCYHLRRYTNKALAPFVGPSNAIRLTLASLWKTLEPSLEQTSSTSVPLFLKPFVP